MHAYYKRKLLLLLANIPKDILPEGKEYILNFKTSEVTVGNATAILTPEGIVILRWNRYPPPKRTVVSLFKTWVEHYASKSDPIPEDIIHTFRAGSPGSCTYSDLKAEAPLRDKW